MTDDAPRPIVGRHAAIAVRREYPDAYAHRADTRHPDQSLVQTRSELLSVAVIVALVGATLRSSIWLAISRCGVAATRSPDSPGAVFVVGLWYW